jgi:carboxyl-terminal processing protease
MSFKLSKHMFLSKAKVKAQQILVLCALLVATQACRKPVADDPQPVETNENVKVNNWIYDVMSELYFWNTDLPKTPNKNVKPTTFFDGLLKKPDDRFSFITEDYAALIGSLSGVSKEAGYEFNLFLEAEGSSNVIAYVVYIKDNSPASNVDLQRGDIIFKINDTQITTNNYRSLLRQLGSDHTVTYRRYNEATKAYTEMPRVALSAVELPENPNFLSQVIEADGEKIGYFVYNFFAPGANPNDKAYDNETTQIINRFKLEGIRHMVLDLRYNGGGYVSSAVNLASLIGRGVDETKVFYRNQYNSLVQNQILNDPRYGEDFLTTKFVNKPENIGNQLTGKLVVLVSGRTASASELVINGLRPFMEVTIIGDKTTGKNVGSIPIEDEDDPENNWGLLPIVFKSFNSLGQSDYGNGFNPNITVRETSERLRPLGDPNELLLRTAIAHITGKPVPNPESIGGAQARAAAPEAIGSSLDLKVRQGQMIDNTKPASAYGLLFK